ncbi:hypothetical protein IAT40_007203 [Kwoniella sp. CBS 6097]
MEESEWSPGQADTEPGSGWTKRGRRYPTRTGTRSSGATSGAEMARLSERELNADGMGPRLDPEEVLRRQQNALRGDSQQDVGSGTVAGASSETAQGPSIAGTASSVSGEQSHAEAQSSAVTTTAGTATGNGDDSNAT